MKRILLISVGIIVATLICSCFGETCTDNYLGALKVDGKGGGKVLVKYIGPKKRNYEVEFRFNSVGNELPYYNYFMPNTICRSKDFKKNNYNFLEIKNLSSESVYVCAVLSGAEIDRHPNYVRYTSLLDIYSKQDQDPNYDYTKDKSFESVQLDYMDRYDFYERLLKENYPYIIKLAPQQGCVMKWGGLGIKAL